MSIWPFKKKSKEKSTQTYEWIGMYNQKCAKITKYPNDPFFYVYSEALQRNFCLTLTLKDAELIVNRILAYGDEKY